MSSDQLNLARLVLTARKTKDALEEFQGTDPPNSWFWEDLVKRLNDALGPYPLAMQGCRGFVTLGHGVKSCGRCERPAWEHEGVRSTRQPSDPGASEYVVPWAKGGDMARLRENYLKNLKKQKSLPS